MERGRGERTVDLNFISYYCHEVIEVKYAGCFTFTITLTSSNLIFDTSFWPFRPFF